MSAIEYLEQIKQEKLNQQKNIASVTIADIQKDINDLQTAIDKLKVV